MADTTAMDGAETNAAHDIAGVIAPPPLIPLTALLLGTLLQRLLPAPLLPDRYRGVVGGTLIGVALMGGGWAVRTMRAGETPLDPAKPTARIVTAGPFGLSRNPIYVSFLLIVSGVAALMNSRWPVLLLPTAMTVLQKGVIEREERYLDAKFGDDYRAYKTRVRRWL